MQTQLHHANREVRRVRCSPAREYSIARLILAGVSKKAFRNVTMHHIPMNTFSGHLLERPWLRGTRCGPISR